MEFLIETYTAESGMCNLEKKISKIARNTAVHIASEEDIPKITEESVTKILGPSHIKDKYQGNDIACQCCNRFGMDTSWRRYFIY
ncbi:MAG: hypothetical protein H0U95_06525 [Bacteroidetes bacterium]|nr:hypothetical protein [Bacteroidota bacterium]